MHLLLWGVKLPELDLQQKKKKKNQPEKDVVYYIFL